MKITVALLIYKSPAYLDFVMKSLLNHETNIHEVEYLITSNDATEEVIDRAEYWTKIPDIKVRHVEHHNGDANEIWINRVYNAWNRCLIECETEAICFVNSDMAFTDGWLDNLAKHDLDRFIPTSRLIESERMPSLPGLISKNFGQTLASFKKDEFEAFAKEALEDGVTHGVGAYMPSLFKKDALYRAGGWRKNWNNVPGDRITFDILARQGLKRVMVRDSIAYHFQRGESAEAGDL